MNRQCTHVLERVRKDENVEMWTDDGGRRREKVNKRLSSREKMLGRLAKYTFPGVFSEGKEGPDAALVNALSIWVGPKQHLTTTDIQ